jgi:hypothetical protein
MCAFEAKVPIGHARRYPIQKTELSNLKYSEVNTDEKTERWRNYSNRLLELPQLLFLLFKNDG